MPPLDFEERDSLLLTLWSSPFIYMTDDKIHILFTAELLENSICF